MLRHIWSQHDPKNVVNVVQFLYCRNFQYYCKVIFAEALKLTDIAKKENYRSVSVFLTLFKVFKRLTQSQPTQFVCRFFSPHHRGYSKSFNTQYVLISFNIFLIITIRIKKWRISLEKGGYLGTMLMDLTKAFDTFSHE